MSIEHSVSKQWRLWSDAAYCGVWPGSALFVHDKKDAYILYPYNAIRAICQGVARFSIGQYLHRNSNIADLIWTTRQTDRQTDRQTNSRYPQGQPVSNVISFTYHSRVIYSYLFTIVATISVTRPFIKLLHRGLN